MKIIGSTEEYNDILKNNDKVFVDFYADWCGPCKMVGPIVEEISNEMKDVTFVKVNVDNLPDVARRYGIMSIPTMMVFNKGEEAGTLIGFKPKEDIVAFINK